MIDTMLKLIPLPQLDMEAQEQLLILQLSLLLNLLLMWEQMKEIYISMSIFIHSQCYGLNAELVPSQQLLTMVNNITLSQLTSQLYTLVFSVAVILPVTQQLTHYQNMDINITNITTPSPYMFNPLNTLETKS